MARRRTRSKAQDLALKVRDRQEAEGHLRKACISLFKMMTPEHPEAVVERHRVYERFKKAMGLHERLTIISLSFVGKDDLLLGGTLEDVYGRPVQVSGMDLLVQKEGSDAFLDPKQAIKVVRRKYSMMNLVNSMNMSMGRRNIFSVTFSTDVRPDTLNEFCACLHRAISESRDEEEAFLERDLKRFSHEEVEVHTVDHVVGQTLRLPWRLKVETTLMLERMRLIRKTEGKLSPTRSMQLVEEHARNLGNSEVRAWILFGDRIQDSFQDLIEDDIRDALIRQLDERALATVLTSLLENFHQLRREHLKLSGVEVSGAEDEEQLEEQTTQFTSHAKGKGEIGDRLLLHAQALDRIQELIGRSRFLSLAKAKRAENFQREAQEGQDYQALSETTDAQWERALQQAYSFGDPLYRAKALLQLGERLRAAGEDERAKEVALDAFRASEDLSVDVVPILSEVVGALLEVDESDTAADALRRGLEMSHDELDEQVRATNLMVMTSGLLQVAKVPEDLKGVFTEMVVGNDLNFWGYKELQPSLVEGLLSQVDLTSPHTDLLIRKLLTHPNFEVRRSAVRMTPFDNEEYRQLLLGILDNDDNGEVRIEIMERIGYSKDAALGAYLMSHLKHNHRSMDATEKKVLALNLARIDLERYLPVFNLMLGSLATKSPHLLGGQKPFRDDHELQLASLEVLYRLNSRVARKIIWQAHQEAKGEVATPFRWAWKALKRQGYREPELPRSRLDPEWVEADDVPLLDLIRPEKAEEEEEDKESGGLLARLKSLRLKKDEETEGQEEEEEEEIIEGEELVDPILEKLRGLMSNLVAPEGAEGVVSPTLFVVRARLKMGEIPVNDLLPITFRLYASATAAGPLWEERHSRVLIREGVIASVLGTLAPLPDNLPGELFLGIKVYKSPELSPRLRIWREDSLVTWQGSN